MSGANRTGSVESTCKSTDALFITADIIRDSATTAVAKTHHSVARGAPAKGWRWILLRAVNCLAFILFLVCAVFQHNDPDPYLWFPIYLVPSFLALALTVCPALAAKKMPVTCLMHLHLVASLAALGYLGYAPIATGGWKRGTGRLMNDEEAMEAVGLLLVIGWLAGQLMVADFATRTAGFGRPCIATGCLICLTTALGFPALLLPGNAKSCRR